MKFYGVIWGGKMNKWLNFSGDPECNPVLAELC